ncbi:MAG: right-handed parallel beta-helix repeat-containing protein [Planctomycetia bacterium]|nr:right-handed parallel beta-helix repeat-containing protein [Planctomycetia bacterium]
MLTLRWRNWLASLDGERRRGARRPRFRPSLECLEDRRTPATITVTNTLDSGAGSLREAIDKSNASVGVIDTILFNIPTSDAGFQDAGTVGVFDPGDYWSIQLQSALPTITDAVIIDGWTQSGFSDRPIIELDGTAAGAVNGLTVTGKGSTIRGLIINRFGGAGIRLDPSSSLSGNLLQGNFIGVDASGTLDRGNGRSGVEIVNAAANTIGGDTALDPRVRNVISGNDNVGVAIYGSGADRNLVQGNFIGTDVSGTLDLGNAFQGVYIGDGSGFSPSVPGVAANNTVGGLTTTPGTGLGNLISGNDHNGIWINGGKLNAQGAPIGANLVQGNLIGTDVTGNQPLGNARVGVLVVQSGSNTIAGANAQGRNVISGNLDNGVAIYGLGADHNLVQHNFIGTNITGDAALGNLSSGVLIGEDPHSKFTGSATRTLVLNNVLSGNGTAGVNGEGVEIAGVGADFNVVQGNLIGTDATGTLPLGNLISGVQIVLGASHNTIGGSSAAARNIIADNGLDGVNIFGTGTDANVVSGNYIGINLDGNELGNARHGVAVRAGAADNTVGGNSARTRNLISGNVENGVQIDGGSIRNLVAGNFIGTDLHGVSALPNGDNGVLLLEAENNTIGGATAGLRNIISGNGANGVVIAGSTELGNLVVGNFIGTDRTGTRRVGNFLDGVVIRDGASFNTIGGASQPSPTGGLGNVISGNNFGVDDPDIGTGVVITGADSNLVRGNFIGVDVTGNRPLPNHGNGVAIVDAAWGNTVAGNVISANTGDGVGIAADASNNLLRGNRIGTGVGGGALGNAGHGVAVADAFDNTIGGLSAGFGNVIAFNRGAGVSVLQSPGITILSNAIFENGGLGIDLVGGTEDGFGVTANDDDDDPDGDGLQNYPLLVSAQPGSTVIAGTLRSASDSTYLLQFFASQQPDPSGHGEGQFLIGSAVVTTNSTGLASFRFVFAAVFPQGGFITATATRIFIEGSAFFSSTSEFSGYQFLPPSSPSPSPIDPADLDPPPDPADPQVGGAAELAGNVLFAGTEQRRLLQSGFRSQEQTLGGGALTQSLLGAVFNGELGGGLFDDLNGNGRLDPGELPLVGQIVYLDANDDGALNDDEWWTITNKRGEYRFQNLPPGRYIVRPVTAYETTVALLNKGYQVKRTPPMLTTAPVTGRQQAELTSQQRSVIDLNFTARVRPDVRPFAPINPTPDKTTPTGPQGRLPRDPVPEAPRVEAPPAPGNAAPPEPAPSE